MTPARKDPLADLSPDATLTVLDAAARLGVSHALIRDAIRAGELPAHIPGGRPGRASGRLGYRIYPADLRDWYFKGGRT